MNIRVGFGFDTHTLQTGCDLWLGGIKLSAVKGAVGHSDADVLIHAICDALLGAACLGDIGTHFPNTEECWKDMDSKYFLKKTTELIGEEGWFIANVDSTICLERPKVLPYTAQMREKLASIMGISEKAISVKATTNEGLGYVGREEGVNAYAVTLISR